MLVKFEIHELYWHSEQPDEKDNESGTEHQFEDITIIEMTLADFLNPREVTALLLNIYWDGVLVYDKTRALHSFLDRIKGRIAESGLKRIKDGRAYGWELPEPMNEVEIL